VRLFPNLESSDAFNFAAAMILKYVEMLDLVACHHPNWRHAVETSTVARHLRRLEHHSEDRASATRIQRKLLEKKAATDLSALANERRNYLSTVPFTSCLLERPLLAAEPPLPVLDGFKSLQCSYCSTSAETVRKHMHSCPCSRSKQNTVAVKVSTILGGNKTHYFVIEVDKASSKIAPLLDVMKQIEGSRSSTLQDHDVSQMDSFLAELRFDRHVKAAGLSLEDAYALSSSKGAVAHRNLSRVLKFHMAQAFDVTKREVHIKLHLFMDLPLDLAVNEGTLEKYERIGHRLLCSITEICEAASTDLAAGILSVKIRESVLVLMKCWGGKKFMVGEEILLLLHGVLMDIFSALLTSKTICYHIL